MRRVRRSVILGSSRQDSAVEWELARGAGLAPISAASADGARAAYETFERTSARRCPGVVTSLREGEEFRRRVKTQASLPNEDAALLLLFSLVASGQIRLRRIDGWQKIATVLRQHNGAA